MNVIEEPTEHTKERIEKKIECGWMDEWNKVDGRAKQ